MGKNGDLQTGWMKERVLECSFQVDKFQQLSTIQGLSIGYITREQARGNVNHRRDRLPE